MDIGVDEDGEPPEDRSGASDRVGLVSVAGEGESSSRKTVRKRARAASSGSKKIGRCHGPGPGHAYSAAVRTMAGVPSVGFT
jgi:hypothetical protein